MPETAAQPRSFCRRQSRSLVRRVPRAPRRDLRRAGRRGGDAARPQRRRQDHDAQGDHGHRREPHRLGALRGPRADQARLQRDRPRRHRLLPRGARDFFQSRRQGESVAAAAGAARRPRSRSHFRAVSRICANGSKARAPNCPAASSRCWRSPASCAPARGSCCSTSRPRGWPRSSFNRSATPSARSRPKASPSSWSSRISASPPTVADRFYVMEHGRIVDHFSNAQLKNNMEKLHDYLGV